MPVILANNVSGTLRAEIEASDTEMYLVPGNGDTFPSPTGIDYFYATIQRPDGVYEIVKVTSRVNDTLYMTRAQEGTTARNFVAGSRVELRITARSVTDAVYESKYLGSSNTDPTERLDGTALIVGDYYFNNVNYTVRFYNGSAWQPFGSGVINIDNFTGDGTEDEFTLSLEPVSENNTQVFIDGVYQQKNTYSTSGTTLTFSEAPPLNATIEVVILENTSLLSTDAALVSYSPGNAPAVETTVQEKLRETVSVKDYGAVCDGVTDDSAAFQAAINALEDTNKVLLLCDDMLISSPIVLKGGMVWYGGSIILDYADNYIFNSDYNSNGTVNDLTIDNVKFYTSNATRGFRFYNSSGGPPSVTVDNFTVKNCQFVSDSLLSVGAIFIGYPQQNAYHVGREIKILNNIFINFNGTGAVYLMDTISAVVSGNTFRAEFETKSFPVHVYVIGAHRDCKNIVVDSNYFEGVNAADNGINMGYGIYDGDGTSDGCIYSNNVFNYGTISTTEVRATAITVRDQNHHNTIIANNTIIPNVSGYGFECGLSIKNSTKTSLVGNNIECLNGDCIREELNEQLLIEGNNLYSSRSRSIRFGSSTDSNADNGKLTVSKNNYIQIGNTVTAYAYRIEQYRSGIIIDGDVIDRRPLSSLISDANTDRNDFIFNGYIKHQGTHEPKKYISGYLGSYYGNYNDGDGIEIHGYRNTNKKHVLEHVVRQTGTGQLAFIHHISNQQSASSERPLGRMWWQTSLSSTAAGDFFIQGHTLADGYVGVGMSSTDFIPTADDKIQLGRGSNRWSQVFAVNGAISTSDKREKQQVRNLSDAEKAVATKLKDSIKTFKFNDAVSTKGDGARIHVGVVAQEVIDIFASEGLEATDYSLLCYDKWYEYEGNEVEVDKDKKYVKSHYEVNGEIVYPDDNGDYPENAVEIINKYDTVEKDRYGVRYEELLAFIIGAI